jgi:hypothetical protein
VKSLQFREPGVALGTVLVCLLALTVIVFAAVTGSISHLRLVSASESQEHAKNLAESAIATAIDEITQSGSQPGDISVTIPGVDGAGSLTFNSSTEPTAYSTYNIDGDASVNGARGRVVPAQTVHLVGKGKVGSAQAYVECVYYRPPFPDGLIASGPVKASALKLYAIRRDDSYAGGDPEDILSEDELPGNLFSNFGQGWAVGEPTTKISDNSDISGSLGSVGTIEVDGGSVVGGERLPGSQSRPIPNLNIVEKINILKPNAIPYSSSTLDPDWFVLSSGALNVTGDLDLNGSALLVEGDLNVQGAVVGTGVVLVNGNVTITDGGSDVTAGEQTAIACTRDFKLSATTPEGNYFKGLVYCEGDFLAKDITVVGATVVNAEDNPSARGQAELENVRFVYNPGSVNLNLMAPRSFEVQYSTSGGGRSHHVSVALLRIPASDEDGFKYKVFGATTWKSDAAPDSPKTWSTYGSDDWDDDWAWHLSSDTLHINTEMTLPELQAHPEVVGLAQTIGSRFQQDENKPISEVDWTARLLEADGLARLLKDDLNGSAPNYNITFTLNNLLGELTATSRVLLWRPFPVQ